jgi:hypothetical protein
VLYIYVVFLAVMHGVVWAANWPGYEKLLATDNQTSAGTFTNRPSDDVSDNFCQPIVQR